MSLHISGARFLEIRDDPVEVSASQIPRVTQVASWPTRPSHTGQIALSSASYGGWDTGIECGIEDNDIVSP